MKKQQNKTFFLFTKRDIIVIAVVLAVASTFFALKCAMPDDDVTARVIFDGQTVFEEKLSEITEKTVLRPTDGVEIVAEDGKIGFVKSDCKGHECINCGMLSHPYDTASCIPNRVIITLMPSAKSNAKYDAVVY